MRLFLPTLACLLFPSVICAAPIVWDFESSNGLSGSVTFDDTHPNYAPLTLATLHDAITVVNLEGDGAAVYTEADGGFVEIAFGLTTHPDDLAGVDIILVDTESPGGSGEEISIFGFTNGTLATANSAQSPRPIGDGRFSLATPVPEPAAVAIWMLLGLAGFGYYRVRRKK